VRTVETDAFVLKSETGHTMSILPRAFQ
jgi:hypothetical protein